MMRNDTSDAAVGKRVKDLRKKAHPYLSMDAVARVIDVSRTTYSKVEDGKRPLERAEAAKLAAYYRVDERWITHGLSAKECAVLDLVLDLMRKPDAA